MARKLKIPQPESRPGYVMRYWWWDFHRLWEKVTQLINVAYIGLTSIPHPVLLMLVAELVTEYRG